MLDFDDFVLCASTGTLADATTEAARTHADAVEFRMDLADDPFAALDDYDGSLPVLATFRPTDGVIKGYSASVDYQRSGYPLRMLLYCTASIPERGDIVADILEIDGVVSVQELVTGEQNLLVTAVGKTDGDITPVAQALLDMGLTVADEVLVRTHETTPFGKFDSGTRASDDS